MLHTRPQNCVLVRGSKIDQNLPVLKVPKYFSPRSTYLVRENLRNQLRTYLTCKITSRIWRKTMRGGQEILRRLSRLPITQPEPETREEATPRRERSVRRVCASASSSSSRGSGRGIDHAWSTLACHPGFEVLGLPRLSRGCL